MKRARRTEMTNKRMKKIMKRNKRRRVAQGIGAAAGVAFWTVIIGAIMAGEKKLDEYKTKFEDIPESEKEAE
jgi:hypothetical protein